MEELGKKPLISVIVPVYNGENVIRRCLDSVLNQTYQNLEVVVVNDGSSDATPDILQSYKEQWGEKLQIINIENSGQGKARSIGIQKANGSLLGFCDADDYYNLNGFEIMERSFRKQKADILYIPCIRDKQYLSFRIGEILPPYLPGEIIRRLIMFGFYNILVKKELLLEMGEIPPIIYEDIAYVGALLTKAENLAYYPHPVYHYVDTPGSVVNSRTNPRLLDLCKAIDWALAHAGDQFREELTMALAQKCLEKVKSLWFYGDCFFEKLRSMKPVIESNPCYREHIKEYKVLSYYLELPGTLFPRTVYMDGISRRPGAEEKEAVRKNAFRDGAEVIVLTGEENGGRFTDKRMAAAYCGIKRVLETGGIYIGGEIRITGPFDCMRIYRSFFGYEHRTLLSAGIFGGQKGDPVFAEILKFWTEKASRDCTLEEGAQLLTDCLVSKYGLRLKGENTYTQYPFCTLSPTVVTVDYTQNPFHLCELVREEKTEDMQQLSRDQIRGLAEMSTVEQAKLINNQKAKIARLEFRMKEANQEIADLRKLKKNDSYQLLIKLEQKKWGRWILRILKHFFK